MKIPIVAIIGQPNVGKSTLFNRLIGKRKAIVHDEPGITRDRHYELAEWSGKNFMLIDTGGFIPDSTDEIEKAVREQSQIAMEEADLLVFVVDAQIGITPLEISLTKILRKTDKPIILTINKIDSAKSESLGSEFYKLGIKDVFSISALASRNIGDFLDLVVKNLPTKIIETEKNDRIKLAVIGKPNVGKSTFTNTLCGKNRSIVTPIPGTTRDSINSEIKFNGKEITIIDTAGLVKKKRLKSSVEFYSSLRTSRSIEESDVSIILFDATEELEKQNFHIVTFAAEQRKGIIIAVNKWDLIEKDSYSTIQYEKSLKQKLRKYDHIPIIFISAKNNLRVQKTIEMAIGIYDETNKRIPTSLLNQKIIPDIQSHPPSTKTGRDVKLNYVTQTKVAHPLFVFFASEPELVSDSYKNYLENRIRKHFGFNGVQVSILLKRKRKK